ncbi:hypothetical protein K1T71_010349 [Dendrolimus kikuchii]|uniref:Uncharacterized protein n=1 Tax=Dendrolimus kikuchii TaxID=765133 RepID=A0ACC1CRB7_9NEOP|nr:hypothetical protein K1T71_010349 [Dendrolimus kikuchii]
MQELISKFDNLHLMDFQIRQCYWVNVTHINNPHDFYVRTLGVTKYLKDLEKKGDPVTLQDLTVTPIVIYKSKILKKYVRGKINGVTKDEVNSSPMFNFFAIDYGCVDNKVSINMIWLPLCKSNIEPLAIPCKLHLCMPNGKEWLEQDIEGMKILVGNESAQIRICGIDAQVYIVELYSGGPDDVSTLMMYTGCSNFGYINQTVNKIDSIKPAKQYFKTKQLRVGEELHVRVLNGRSLKSFYVAQINDYSQYIQSLNDFKDYCKRQNSPEFDEICIGHSYGVYLIGENSYERGVVKKIDKNKQKLDMLLIDKGNEVTIPYEHLKILKKQIYYELCSIAIHCMAEESQVWDNGLHKFLYPGVQLCITVKQLSDKKTPHVVNIVPLK